MTVFADSSALVKRYADEEGGAAVRAITEPLVVSALARVEVPSALWRKHGLGDLTNESVTRLIAEFEFEWFGDETIEPVFNRVQVTWTLLDDAALQVARHGLRAADAIQLATALAVRAIEPAAGVFAAFDQALRSAAAVEGFTLLPST